MRGGKRERRFGDDGEVEGRESAVGAKGSERNGAENARRRHWANGELGTPRAPTDAWRRGGRGEKGGVRGRTICKEVINKVVGEW